MDRRIFKRFMREHRQKTPFEPDLQWRFHKAQWGDLTVLAMPRSVKGVVFDSNTGVVLKAPYHRALRAGIVVNDGRAVNCDEPALNNIITGDKRRSWKTQIPLGSVYTVPTYRVPPEEINDIWLSAIEDLAKSMPREQAEAALEQTLGWCTDSISCDECGLCVPGHFPIHALQQARAFGWTVNGQDKPVCASHSNRACVPLPTDEEAKEKGWI